MVNYSVTNVIGILEARYIFQYTVFEAGSSEIKRYKASVNLRIDNEAPVIYSSQITAVNNSATTKNVKIIASDGKGSGIAGYYLGATSTVCESTSNVYQESNEFIVTTNGTYKVCVKDNVGKISSVNININ